MSEQENAAFDRLEELVQRAGEEIERLREENQSLTAEVAKLREQADSTSEWEDERDRVAERVASLVDGLEELLDATEADESTDD